MQIGKELNLNMNRIEMREHMKEFDYRRCGRINFMGFLELMSTRREAALKRKAEKMNRIKNAGMSEHKHLEDVVKRKKAKIQRKEESDLRKWARKLGYGIDEVKKLKERFDEQDEDKSGEIDLEELRDMLSTMAVENKEKRYREYVNLSRDEAKLIMDYYDRDGSATMGFPEFLDLLSPRRQKADNAKLEKKSLILHKREVREVMTHNARTRAAWNMYDKHMRRILLTGRRLGYTQVEVEKLYTQFNNFDTDGSGDIDLDELTYIVRNHMKRKDLSRDDLKDMMKEFDHQRNGSIQFIGFLEMMSPRRRRIRERYMKEWEDSQKRARIVSGFEGPKTRYKKYTGGVNVPPLNTGSMRLRPNDHLNPENIRLQRKQDVADSYISNAKFSAPHNPPPFRTPKPPPMSPMRKVNSSRTPRRLLASSEQQFPSLNGSARMQQTV